MGLLGYAEHAHFINNTKPHAFKIGDNVLVKDVNIKGKNAKFAPKWTGPEKFFDINKTNRQDKDY